MPKEKREEKKSKKPALAEFALTTKPGNLYGIFPVSARIHEKEKRRCFFSCSAEMFKIMHVCPEHYQIVPFMETAPVGGALIQPTELRTTAPLFWSPTPPHCWEAPGRTVRGQVCCVLLQEEFFFFLCWLPTAHPKMGAPVSSDNPVCLGWLQGTTCIPAGPLGSQGLKLR